MTNQYQPHEERVIAEKAELDQKIEKLGAFQNTDAFKNLPDEQKKLLIMQCNTMRNYSWILGKRIELFTPNKEDDNDFPLGKACDLSGDGTCESCQ